MTRSTVSMLYPTSDTTDSLQILSTPTTHTISNGTGVSITNAFKCKDNTLTVVITNSGNASGSAIFKKGVYQNAVLGDLTVTVPASGTVVVKVENPSRFEQADASLQIDFSTSYAGTLYAFGKKAGLA